MNLRLPLALALAFAFLPLHAAEENPLGGKKKKHPEVTEEGWLKRIGHTIWPFGKKPGDATPVPKDAQVGKAWKQLVPTMLIEPMPLKLSDVRTMKVTLQLANRGKKLAQLEFPTTQRIEVLVKDSAGKRLEQWSEDQAFQNDATIVTINPAERLEYTANVATRDFKAGQTYTVEAFFPNYDQLRAVKQVTPMP